MKAKLVLHSLLVLASVALLRAAPVDDRIAEGRAALAAHDLATARAKFQQARTAEPTNQTAAALSGLTRWFAMIGDAPANGVLNGLGVSSTGRDVYDWKTSMPENADGDTVLPSGYNLESTRAFWRDTVIPTSAAVRADLAAVTDDNFVLTLSPAETGSSNSITFDRADLLVIQAGLRAFDFLTNLGLGQNFNADYERLVKLAQGDVLTFRQAMEDNPDLLKAGPLEHRLAAKQALLDFVSLYRRASAAVRARAPGVDRMFMLETEQDFSDEAEFRQQLVEVEKAATDYVEIYKGRVHASFAPLATPNWSIRSSLPTMTNGRFDPAAIGDASLGGIVLGTSREFFARALVEAGYTADIGWTRLTPDPVGGSMQKYAYSGTHHVITGQNGTIGRSADGVNWTYVQLPNAQDLFSIASNGAGVLVADGNTQIWRSTDHGATWRLAHTIWRGSAPDNEGAIFGMVYDGSRFVAITAAGWIYTSADLGVTWKRGKRIAPLSTSLNVFGLDHANGMFVAVGLTTVGNQSRSAIFMSADGASWSLVFTGSTSALYRTATFGAGKWVVAGSNGRVAYSTNNGATWAEIAAGAATDSFIGSTFVNGSFVISGNRTGTSPDGATWTFSANPESIAFTDAVSGPDNFTYLPGPQGAIYRFAEGNFTRADANNFSIPRTSVLNASVVFNNKLYVAGNGGMVHESSDGVSFTARPTSTTNTLLSLAVHNGVLYAGAVAGTIVASTDGANWSTLITNDSALTTANIARLTSLNGQLVAAPSANVILTSTDGATWTRRTLPSGISGLISLTSGGGYYVAGSSSLIFNPTTGVSEGSIAYSTDLTNWNRVPISLSSNTANLRSVLFNEGRFYYFLADGRVLRSFNPNPASGWEEIASDLGTPTGAANFGGALAVQLQRVNDEARAGLVYTFDPNSEDWVRTELPSSEFPLGAPLLFKDRLHYLGGQGAVFRANAPFTRPTPAASIPVTLVGQIGRDITLGAPFAASEELDYQWFYNGTAIAGATSATYTVGNLTNARAGTYTVTATGRLSGATATNTVTLLVVNGAPTITQQPSGGLAAAGTSFTFGVAASGSGPLTYQWFKNNAAISGATASALVLNSLTSADAGSYRVEVTNTYGTAVSADVPLAVSAVGAAPTFWDDTEASMYSPSRVFSDGQGRLFMTWNVQSRAQDVVGGVRVGSLFRLHEATGAVDPSFVWDERLGSPLFVCFQPDGKLLVAVNHAYGEGATVVRVNADGSWDDSFVAPRFSRSIRFMHRQPDGKLLVSASDLITGNTLLPAGTVNVALPSVYRLTANGATDDTFAPVVLTNDGTLFSPPVTDAAGNVYLIGNFTAVNGTSRRAVARVDASGVLDGFAAPAQMPGNWATTSQIGRAIVFQSTGKPVIVGRFAYSGRGSLSSDPVMAIRINTDGTFDSTFAQPLRSQSLVNTAYGIYGRFAILDADDKFLLTSDRLLRFNADGTLDSAWPARNTGYTKEIFWICRSATSGNIYLPDLNNDTPGNVVALTAEGAPLAGFNTGGFGSTIVPETAILLNDGRVLAAGIFDHFGSTRQPGTALFGTNGLLAGDSTAFHNPGVLLQNPYAYVFQWPDRSFAVARMDQGEQQTGAGYSEPTFRRFNADGSARGDWSYSEGSALGYNYAPQPDGGVMAWRPQVGISDYVNTGTSAWVRRLNADGSRDATFAPDLSSFVSSSRNASNELAVEFGTIGDVQIAGDGSIFILAAGRDSKVALRKLRPDGTVDATYTSVAVANASISSGFSSLFFDPVRNQQVQAATTSYTAGNVFFRLLPDGSAWVAGALNVGGTARNIVRLTPTGAVDASIPDVTLTNNAPLGLSAFINSLGLDDSGRIYVAGRFDSVNGSAAKGLFRYHNDGSLDTTWAPGVEIRDPLARGTKMVAGQGWLHLLGPVAAPSDARPVGYKRVALTNVAPVIFGQSANRSVYGGQTVQLFAGVFAGNGATYEWTRNGQPILGAVGPFLNLGAANSATAGTYRLTVTNNVGTVQTSDIVVTFSNEPYIATAPASQTVVAGTAVTFKVNATSASAVTYQWELNGNPIAGATSASYTIASTTSADAGAYTVVVTNATGSVESIAATLTVNPPPPGPAAATITQQPVSQTVYSGYTVVLGVAATPPSGATISSYQWYQNGSLYSTNNTSSTTASINLSAPASGVSNNYYVVVNTSNGGKVTSATATLTGGNPVYTTVTLAGMNSRGSTDGTGNSARFSQPRGPAVDSAGNYYIADSGNHTIRRVTPAGVVTTYAGAVGVNAQADGALSAARFSNPYSIIAATNGDIYVLQNTAVRKISGGNVTTLAGSAFQSGAVNATGADARFSGLSRGAIDASGNLYVVDEFNHAIRKITPAGVVTTFAGTLGTGGYADGAPGVGRLSSPRGIVMLADGSFVVADTYNSALRKIDAAGNLTTIVGAPPPTSSSGALDGAGTAARLSNPNDLTVDSSGNLYVMDGSYIVRRVDTSLNVTTLAGSPWNSGSTDSLTGSAARFSNYARGIVWAGDRLVVTDTNSNTLRTVGLAGDVSTLAGLAPGYTDGTGTAARFNQPDGIALDANGDLVVSDTANRVLRKITPSGAVTTLAGSPTAPWSMTDGTGTAATFMTPRGLARHPSTGEIYVFDNGSIRKVATNGTVTTVVGPGNGNTGSVDGSASAARLSGSGYLAFASNGDLYVADQWNNTIRKVAAADLTVTTVAGVAGQNGTVDGSLAGGAANSPVRFGSPRGLTVDSAGNIYVVQQTGGSIVRKIDTAGNVTTLAGVVNTGSQLDGVPPFSRLGYLNAITLGADGQLYTASYGAFHRVDPASGAVSTLFGQPFNSGYVDSSSSSARADYITGIAPAADGSLYFVDSNNNVIRRARAVPGITFTTQPSSQTVLVGANVTFTAAATGVSGLSYQWMKNGVDIAGATSATLSLPNVSTSDAGSYSVRAFAGLSTGTSNTVTLTVNQPVSNDNFGSALQLTGFSGSAAVISNSGATVETGEPIHWSSSGTSTSLWYSYRPMASGFATFDTAGSAIDTALAVYSGSSLTTLAFHGQNNDTPNSNAARLTLPVTAGTTYYIAVVGASGGRGNIALSHNLEVTPEPGVVIATSGQSASFSVQPDSGASVGVQWRMDGTDMAGAVNPTLSQSSAGVFLPGFMVGANPVNFANSLPAVQLSAPANSVTATETFNGPGLGTAWNATPITSTPDTATDLTVARGRLNFGTAYATTDTAFRTVTRTAPLPLDRNWTVVARIGVSGGVILGTGGSGPVRLAAGQLTITNTTDVSDYLVNGFRLINESNASSARLERFAQLTTNNGTPTSLGTATLSSNSIIVRAVFDAVTGNVTTSYSTGGAFTGAATTSLRGPWGVTSAGTVTVGVGGAEMNLTIPAGAVWVDDFAVVVEPPAAPTIASQPVGGTFAEGSINGLAIAVTSVSSAPVTYQWFKDGTAIAGATSRTYNATAAGSYTVAVTQNGITVTSNAAVIALTPSAPTFFASGNISSSFAAAGAVVPEGSSAVLSVSPAAGSAPMSYQWRFNGQDIPGATESSYFIADWRMAHSGLYSVRATNSHGTATSPEDPFFVTPEGGWRWRNPTPTGNGATRVAFLNGQFLLGGLRGTLLASSDGLTWTTRQVPAQNNIFKLVTLGERTLAMGSLNGMFASKDTVTWETRPTGINGALTSLQDMVAGNGRVVAFGTGGVTAVTTDGVNWTAGTLGNGINETLLGAAFVLNKYYGVSGTTGKVFSSADGTNWTAVNTGVPSLQSLAYGVGRLVAVGPDGKIVVSTNGTDWTTVSSGTTNHLRGVNFVNNRFVAVGVTGTILTSPDGLVWTPRSVPGVTAQLQNTAFGNNRYVIAGQAGRVILTSTDAENWSVLTAGPHQGTAFNGVAASASVAVAVGDFGALVSSTDGATWAQRNSTTTNRLLDVTFAQSKFAAVGTAGTVLTSGDGTNWTWQTLSPVLSTNGLQGIRYSTGAGLWIIVGDSGSIYTSPDGTTFTWTKRATSAATTAQLRRVAVGNGMHVAVGNTGTIASAADPADTWTLRTSGTTAHFNDVVHGNGAFVAVGNNGTVSRSTDGTNWTTTTLGVMPLFSVTYLNGHFVVTSQSNNYYTSTDGITWTGRTTGAADPLNDTVLFGNQVVGVGPFGTILTADLPVIQGGGAISVDENAPATIKFAVSNSPFPVTYQWFKNGQAIAGPNSPVLRLAAVTAADAGSYTLQATNAFGTATSSTPVVLSLNVSLSITTHPAPQTALLGGSATFSVVAAGVPAPTYQWRLNGVALPGATSSSVTLNNLRLADNGTVTVAVTNSGGTIVSNGAALTVNPLAPTITSPLTALAVANVSFRYQIVSSQSATFGATGLPAGLAINTTTGVIEGAPTQTGSFSVTLTATNATGSDQKTLTLTVQPPGPVITSPPSASGRVGQAFSYTITATHSPTIFSASTLPPGLSITGATISGTPTAAGFYTVTVGAQNVTGGATQPVNIDIAASLNAPVFTGATTISGTAGGSFTYTPNFGTGNTSFALVNLPDGTSSTLPTGLTFNTSTGTISGTTALTGTFKVAIRATNPDGTTTQVITFTINPAASAPVATSTGSTVGTVGSAFTFTITTNPAATSFASTALPAGLSLNASTGVITGVPTEPGISNVTLTLTNSAGSSTGSLMITINSSALAPVITNTPIATGTAGTPFSFTLTGSNSPTSFTIVSGTLPTGLSLNATNGVISGTPSTPAQARVWVAAANAAGGRGPAVEMLFDIRRALTVPVITSNGTAFGQVGQPFQYQIQATNAPTSYTATALPGGLSFSTSTGIISGLPTTETSTPFDVTLTASNADGASAPKTLAITITPAPATPRITSPLNVGGRAGSAFSYQITATESPTSYASDQLPAGLSLNSTTGVISGAPTSAGTATVQIRAANAAGLGQASTLTIDIAAPLTAPAITSDATANGKVGTLFTYQITATNSPTSYGLSGTLPLGLSINTTTGVISGNPADNPGLYTVTLTAMNAAGTSQPQTLLIGVAPADNAPVITSPTTATAMVSVPFSYQITATNVPNTTPFPPSVFLDAINLPPGLAINASTGLIQGTPNVAGTYLVSLVGINANGTGLPRTLTLTVYPAPNAPVVNSAVSVSARAGTVFTYRITATNDPTSFEALDAPAWLSVNTTTGVLSGTPTGPGTVSLRVGASNAGGSSVLVPVTVSIAAAPNTPVVTSSQTASGRVGQAFSYDIAATLSPTSYVVSGLPAGLTVDTTTGQIRGTPTVSGKFNVTLSGVNANGEGQPVVLVITIATSIQLAGG